MVTIKNIEIYHLSIDLEYILSDEINNVALAQWHDNKIVNVVSTLGVCGKGDVKRRAGQSVVDISTENA